MNEFLKKKPSLIVQVHLVKDGFRAMGIPLERATQKEEDSGKWILPHGLELYVASATHNHKHYHPVTGEAFEATHVVLTAADLTKFERVRKELLSSEFVTQKVPKM